MSRVDPLGLIPYAAAQQNRPEPPQEHYAPGENLREGGFYDRLGCEEKKVIWQYQQAFTSYNAGAAYEFFYFGSISSMLNPVMADRVGVLMAKLFSGGYEINGREFNRGREDTSDLLTCIGLVMLLNGAVGAAKGSALGGNLQYAMAGGGTMDAAMAITAENAIVIAALNSMYPDTSNDGIIRRIEGKAGAELDTGKWNKGSYDNAEQSLQKHFEKHGDEVGAKDPQQYLRKAEEFAKNLKGARKAYNISGETPNVTRYYKNGKYIDLAPDGTIISYGKQ